MLDFPLVGELPVAPVAKERLRVVISSHTSWYVAGTRCARPHSLAAQACSCAGRLPSASLIS